MSLHLTIRILFVTFDRKSLKANRTALRACPVALEVTIFTSPTV
jgi:hypothetical protein